MSQLRLKPVHYYPVDDPTNEIFDLAAFKARLKVDTTSEDDFLNDILDSLTLGLEEELMRPIRRQEFYHYLDYIPQDYEEIWIEKTPVVSVDEIASRDGDDWTVLGSDKYRVHRTWDVPRPPLRPTIIEPKECWDFDTEERIDPIRIKTTSGWDPIPKLIQDCGYRMGANMFSSRVTVSDFRMYETDSKIGKMLEMYRLPSMIKFF